MDSQQENGREDRQTKTLRILAVADQVEPQLYHNSVADWIGPVDLLVSCGDLPPYYLDFLISNLGARMVHVLGNHCYVPHDEHKRCAPEAYPGVFNLHKKVEAIVAREGDPPLLVAGLEGSPWYKNGPHQYTEAHFALNVSTLVPRLLLNKAQSGRYLDILVTHAPPRGIHDNNDRAHIGFTSLLPFLERFKPALLLHGHTHRYDPTLPMRTRYKDTEVINAYGHVLLELVMKENGAGWQIKPKAESSR
ncbi:MAG TPA: metallophosphoesterase [Chloroflexia bacterium]|nr:metallophosphoesterase [Chloroflexia bacterium]